MYNVLQASKRLRPRAVSDETPSITDAGRLCRVRIPSALVALLDHGRALNGFLVDTNHPPGRDGAKRNHSVKTQALLSALKRSPRPSSKTFRSSSGFATSASGALFIS